MRILALCVFLASTGLVAKAAEQYRNRYPTTKLWKRNDCIEGYFRDGRGCRKDPIVPEVVISREGARNIAETGSIVTLICRPSDRGEGVYSWFVKGNPVIGVNTSTYTFSLASGVWNVRCDFPQYINPPVTNIKYVPGITMLVDNSLVNWVPFENVVQHVPSRALPGTVINVTCYNVPLTRQVPEVSWKFYRSFTLFKRVFPDTRSPAFETQGVGLFQLTNLEINAKNAGHFVTCHVLIPSSIAHTKRAFKTRLPAQLETDIPDIVIEEGDRFAKTGESVPLTCGFQGQPFSKKHKDITWSWYRNDILQPGLTTSHIVLTSVSKSAHEGKWKCKAQYKQRPARESDPINVRLDSILSVSLVIEAFSPFTSIWKYANVVRCEARFEFDVPITYSWTRNNNLLVGFTDNVLLYANLTNQLRCIATADLVSATSNAVVLTSPASERDLSEYVCPESFQFNGLGDLSHGCECRQGYQLDQYGCRREPITPHVALGRKGASRIGETGASVTVNCVPSDLGDGAYLWTVNGVTIDGANTWTYTFNLAKGNQDIRCQIQQFNEGNMSKPFQLTGYDSFADAPEFTNEVEGAPDTAVAGTLIDVTCTNIPWTTRPLEIKWTLHTTSSVSGEVIRNGTTFEKQSVGLYELTDVEINTENAGNIFSCQILFPPSVGSSTPIYTATIPAQLETDIPDIVIEEGNRFAKTGKSVSLTCGFKGQPFTTENNDITWSWYRNDILQPGLITSDIVLTSVSKAAHGGKWQCKAQFKQRPARESYYVYVRIDETIRPVLRKFPIANVSVIFQCGEFHHRYRSPITFFPHSYSWTRNDEVLDGYTDNILLLDSQDMGIYTCTIHADFLSGTSDTLTVS